MATLYEIEAGIRELLEYGFNEQCIDKETGEILTEKAQELLDGLCAEREKKIENIAIYIKNLDYDITDIKAEEKALAERRKAKERKRDSLKAYLLNALNANNQKKFECTRALVSIKNTKIVDITKADDIPKEFLREKIEYAPDKAAIKKAIDAGQTVNGAQVIDNQTLSVK